MIKYELLFLPLIPSIELIKTIYNRYCIMKLFFQIFTNK